MSAAVEFAVWAPVPERVRLQVGGAVHDMRREEGGWWRAEVEAGPEADYGFLLGDDDTPRPAPRSRRQPEGVHGLSRRHDPASYEWGDRAWTGRPLAGGVVYEMHVGTRSEEHTSELQSRQYLVCRLLLEKKNKHLYSLTRSYTPPG